MSPPLPSSIPNKSHTHHNRGGRLADNQLKMATGCCSDNAKNDCCITKSELETNSNPVIHDVKSACNRTVPDENIILPTSSCCAKDKKSSYSTLNELSSNENTNAISSSCCSGDDVNYTEKSCCSSNTKCLEGNKQAKSDLSDKNCSDDVLVTSMSNPVKSGCINSSYDDGPVIAQTKTNCNDGESACCSSSEAPKSNQDEAAVKSCCSNTAANHCNGAKIVPLQTNQTNSVNNQSVTTCLAVIRPDHASVVVFDSNGQPKSFKQSSSYPKKNLSMKKLCFSSHGAGPNVDGMLTHCFDAQGIHGMPEESCVCGLEIPHIHAHLHGELCDETVAECCDEKRMNHKKRMMNQWRFLSQITLHLDESSDKNDRSVALLPINPSLPKECNSLAVKSHLQERGLDVYPRTCCEDDEECQDHRKYKVHHDDHTDYLVHDETSGGLHLEHPCGDCGETDIHGRFHLIHTRSWLDDANPATKNTEFRVHFFEEPHVEPFHLLDALSHMFELNSSRVNAVRVVDDSLLMERRPSSASTSLSERSTKMGRSQFYVEKICCASEAKQIQSILKINGIVEVSVNTTTKMAYVHHDPNAIAARDIADILNEQNFGAHIKKDCAVEAARLSGIPTDVSVESKFSIVSESNDLSIEAFLKEEFKEGLEISSMNFSRQTLLIEHNPYYLTASTIAHALNSNGFEITIQSDGGAGGLWALAAMRSEEDDVTEHHKSSIHPTVILSGVFWVVSMLSFIGGNWDYLKYLALLSVMLGLPPIAMKACRTLRRFQFDVNCMMLFAVLGALALREFTEAAAVTFLFAFSEVLESKCTARARNALGAIMSLRPEHANLINPITQDTVVLPAAAVAVGSLVRVRPGDKVRHMLCLLDPNNEHSLTVSRPPPLK